VQRAEIVTAMACLSLDSDGVPSTANPRRERIPHVKRPASRRTACTAALVLRKVKDVRACGEVDVRPPKPANVPLFVQLDSASDNKCSFNRQRLLPQAPPKLANVPLFVQLDSASDNTVDSVKTFKLVASAAEAEMSPAMEDCREWQSGFANPEGDLGVGYYDPVRTVTVYL